MFIKRLSLILLITMSLMVGCACNKQKKAPAPQAPVTLVPNSQNNDFACQLYGKVEVPGKNLFYSPYSISTALSMTWAGAKGNTAEEMAKAMSFNLPFEEQHASFRDQQKALNAIGKRGKAQLSVANAIFDAKIYEKLLVPDFVKLLKDYYDSAVYSLDFGDYDGASKYINTWVEERTNNRIKDLVSPQHIRDSNDGMVLVNAIFFKGNWLLQFNPKNSVEDTFYTESKRSVESAKPVKMMTQTGEFPYAEMDGYQILELPYSESELAMLVVIPDDIDSMKENFSPKLLAAWQAQLRTQEVKVFMPAFKLELTLNGLPGKLKEMGMIDAFDEVRADFSGIRRSDTGKGLYIQDIIHKAFIEVNEEGTEAAAATAVVMGTKSVAMPSPVFRADRPFLYMILHKPTNNILFLGKFADPPKL
ncbi:MAG TPA: serpin family protein [Candidatus Cloacimonadota bacterium]|nr:serpin family protein [Candidatus Cloacimonadota bacterium]